MSSKCFSQVCPNHFSYLCVFYLSHSCLMLYSFVFFLFQQAKVHTCVDCFKYTVFFIINAKITLLMCTMLNWFYMFIFSQYCVTYCVGNANEACRDSKLLLSQHSYQANVTHNIPPGYAVLQLALQTSSVHNIVSINSHS